MNSALLIKGREVCPKCKKKGVGYAGHAHAFGQKDYNRGRCRYCKAGFTLRVLVRAAQPTILVAEEIKP